MFQISIAVAAISAFTKRRRFWIFGLAFGIVSVAFRIQGSGLATDTIFRALPAWLASLVLPAWPPSRLWRQAYLRGWWHPHG